MSAADVQSLAESAAKIHDSAVLITDTMRGLPKAIAAEVAKSPRAATSATATNTSSPASGLMLMGAVLAGMNIMLVVVICLMGIKIIGMDDKLTAIYMLAPHLQPEAPK
ncbi:MAG: hypothetical protein V4636_20100 [Pseudomonadota bacterium]